MPSELEHERPVYLDKIEIPRKRFLEKGRIHIRSVLTDETEAERVDFLESLERFDQILRTTTELPENGFSVKNYSSQISKPESRFYDISSRKKMINSLFDSPKLDGAAQLNYLFGLKNEKISDQKKDKQKQEEEDDEDDEEGEDEEEEDEDDEDEDDEDEFMVDFEGQNTEVEDYAITLEDFTRLLLSSKVETK
jgi:hypothetical protein